MSSPAEFIDDLIRARDYDGQIVHVEHIPSKEASFQSLETPPDDRLQDRLRFRGIRRFYVHQAEAIDAVRRGQNVVVATSTASGKSLCYSLPAIEGALRSKSARYLFLFPTKALAQDQLRSLKTFAPDVTVATFDGDTPGAARSEIRRQVQIVLTNPDMLHLGILPNHGRWRDFLRNLKMVVIDEAHVYRGVFGSHVANVIRRLRRLCRLYGSNPVFVASSATIANPGAHFRELVGTDAQVVSEDGSPHGPKEFVFWNPPVTGDGTVRQSANSESADILAALVRRRLRTIAFTKTRKLAELVYMYAKNQLMISDRDLSERIAPYRAGYLASDRRTIERKLFNGELIAVTATTALELGVDVGDLSATISTGYPGSISSTWQQAGRSGRGRDPSLSVLVGLDNPLDQYIMRHPEALFGKPHEHARINPSNRRIIAQHVMCAAHERPVSLDDLEWFGDGLSGALQNLMDADMLRKRGDRWFPTASIEYPAADVDIRSASGQRYDLVCDGRLIETIEADTAFFQIHPGAVYLHQGETVLVEELDLETRVARGTFGEYTYYTQTEDQTDLSVGKVLHERTVGGVPVCLGEVDVSTRVLGYKKKRQFSDELIGREALDLPEHRFQTEAVWWTVPAYIQDKVLALGQDFAGGLHAAEHAAIGLLPLYALCDRRDIGGVSSPAHADTGQPSIFIYDGHTGGVGIAERGFEEIESLWSATLQLLRECPCAEGCPSCVQSPKCGNNNDILDKAAAKTILEHLVAAI